MKKILLLFIIAPLLSFNTIDLEKNIVGKWKGEDEKNQIGLINFDKEGYASFEIDGRVMGGKEFDANGEKGSMTYSVNYDANPITIDVTMTLMASKTERQMLFIAEFKDDDTLVLASNFNPERPTEFNADNSITLHRVK